jgi:hypothetical protein
LSIREELNTYSHVGWFLIRGFLMHSLECQSQKIPIAISSRETRPACDHFVVVGLQSRSFTPAGSDSSRESTFGVQHRAVEEISYPGYASVAGSSKLL